MSKTQTNAKRQKKFNIEEFNLNTNPSLVYTSYLAGSLLFLTFIIYCLTLAPTVSGGDSGELITAAYRWGIAHPPGYPLYTILAKLFTFIPYGSIVWRVNLFSATCDSLAATFLCLSVIRWTGNLWPGLLSGALFAFSPLVWSYSTTAEVFALNNLLCVLMIYFIFKFIDSKHVRWIYLTAFSMGLAISNHHTSLFFSIPLGICGLRFLRRAQINLTRQNIVSAVSILILSGLLPYVYLIWAGTHPKTSNWGNISTLSDLMNHILRSDYGTFRLTSSENGSTPIALLFENLEFYLKNLLSEILYLGAPTSLFVMFKRNRKSWGEGRNLIFQSTLLSFISYQLVFNSLANLNLSSPVCLGVLSRFWMLPNILIFIWVGLGVNEILNSSIFSKWKKVALPALAISLAALQMGLNYKQSDQSKNWALYDYGKALLAPLAPHSILVANGDIPRNISLYLQFCENYRTDIRFISHLLMSYSWYNQLIASEMSEIVVPGPKLLLGIDSFEDRVQPGQGYSVRRFIESNHSNAPIYGYALNLWNVDKRFALIPVGLAHQIVPRVIVKTINISELISKYKAEGLKLWNYSEAEPYSSSSWEKDILRTYWEISMQNEDYLKELSQF